MQSVERHKSIDIGDSIKKLCTRNIVSSQHFTSVEVKDRRCALGKLVTLFLDERCTEDVCSHLGHVILNIVEAARVETVESSLRTAHLQFCVALSKAVTRHASLRSVASTYLSSQRFLHEPSVSHEPEPKKPRKSKKPLKHVLEERALSAAAWRFASVFQSDVALYMNWTKVLTFMESHDPETKWFAVEAVAIVTNMSPHQRDVFIADCFDPDKQRELLIKCSNYLQPSSSKHLMTPTDVPMTSLTCDLQNNVVCIEGVLLTNRLAIEETARETSADVIEASPGVVPVSSTRSTLEWLALAVSGGEPILLQGQPGCGKTSAIEHLARVTGQPKLIKIQLADQTDSKALLGTYRCTDIPGEFVWQPGVLTQAVTRGLWVLLEDIDSAPVDVLSMLLPLLKTKTLSIPGHGDCIMAAPGFQIFSTQRLFRGFSGFHQQLSYSRSLLSKAWTIVDMESLSRSELQTIICTRFPKLEKICTRILDIYFLFVGNEGMALIDKVNAENCDVTMENCDVSMEDSVASKENEEIRKLLAQEGRLLSTRDLMRWCGRIERDFTHGASNSGYEILLEALDCFVAFVSRGNRRLPIAASIAARLNVTRLNAEYYCSKYKPTVTISDDCLKVGRVQLPRDTTSSKLRSSTVGSTAPFSFTRPSARLLEFVAVCVSRNEPVLLVGETGTGKTSTVQYLAQLLGHTLRVVNLNQQSDSSDLLGGFKPVDLRHIVRPFREDFEALFCETFSRKQNLKFLGHIQTCYTKRKWADLFALIDHTIASVFKKPNLGSSMEERWRGLRARLHRLKLQIRQTENALAFTFVEGTLATALKAGDWILLDEINLASVDTLQCLSGLLEGASGSVLLSERGDTEPVVRHPDFRLFACMNPATDVGKKDLPAGIRNRFAEFFMDELSEPHDLAILAADYLTPLSLTFQHIEGIVRFYLAVRDRAVHQLTDGTGNRPHFSLRTLCRALSYCARNPCISVMRSLYEGFCMSFLTQLDRSSHADVQSLITKHILSKVDVKAILNQPLPEPRSRPHVNVEGYWIPQGDLPVSRPESYILTASVRLNLHDLARVVAHGSHPVLLQGETSVGKTSLITWLAGATGNRCLRVNNHEHTDLQEYVGCYTPDHTGKLVFREGVLVEAMRKGYWIILDELNLAPSDVLEALNRLLDDNRELFISETQEMVQAHPQFMLFATQNPPGHYGGRKTLSRAFRNRFIELHFDEIPSGELETILHQRCGVPLSYAKRLVAVMVDLQTRRRGSGVFAGKQGFMTLRDLFRWAERYHQPGAGADVQFYDWDQHMADHGYMLLAGRVRCEEEVKVVQETIKKHLKRNVEPRHLFTLDTQTSQTTRRLLEELTGQRVPGFGHLVWTYDMRRLAVLLGSAILFKEPALLVGETGCGKTTLCQLYAALRGLRLEYVSCHLHTESADFLGGLRPVRDHPQDEEEQRLFEWRDGPLVSAMTNGHYFLVDEISLADDSVLERLNSVLEPERSLLLAEKGGGDNEEEVECIAAHPDFRIVGTMNPGGDYGKKELSPALRNRMTEIWCPQLTSPRDLVDIIEHNLDPGVHLTNREDGTSGIGEMIVEFIQWFTASDAGKRIRVSIRDVLAWVQFINTCSTLVTHDVAQQTPLGSRHFDTAVAYVHGACLVFLDTIGSGRYSSDLRYHNQHTSCVNFLLQQITRVTHVQYDIAVLGMLDTDTDGADHPTRIVVSDGLFTVPPFSILIGPEEATPLSRYTLTAPTPCSNAQRILRALQLPRPLLLEGSPGVGKTSLVTAIAKASGHRLTRINLSEQTDVSDLFGADLPMEGGNAGQFAWRDGPLLRSLKAGDWILLDELNLASQSVLEGLNACLDHRAEVFVPELGRTFRIEHNFTRIFACQNPMYEGGGRKGLPRSFLNRFTQVYIEPMRASDLSFIMSALYPSIPRHILDNMVRFNDKVGDTWRERGGCWEFNLRDLLRWADLMTANQTHYDPSEYLRLVYHDRMRSNADKNEVLAMYTEMHAEETRHLARTPHVVVTNSTLQVGHAFLARRTRGRSKTSRGGHSTFLCHDLPYLESIMKCIEMNWMTILVGPSGSGKSSMVQMLADLTGNALHVLPMNSAMDTTELLGAFEQADLGRRVDEINSRLQPMVRRYQQQCLLLGNAAQPIEHVERMCDALSDSNQAGMGVSNLDELVLIRSRLRTMKEIVVTLTENMGEMDAQFHDQIDACLKNIIAMETSIEESNSRCHGGSFEWVDSVLVKALRDGHWLLIDDVNLCSASVLDRLNAVLEPGGVLQINERGVIDGQVPCVAPHENFRMFLAMDPQHGEISRAMRNRGVEVCVLTEGENSYSRSDLDAMLQCITFLDAPTRNKLLDLHNDLLSIAPSNQRPTLSDLLNAGRLTQQNVDQGCDSSQSMKQGVLSVYRSRHGTTEYAKMVNGAIHDRLTTVTDDQSPHAIPPTRITYIGDFCEHVSLAAVVRNFHQLTKLTDAATKKHPKRLTSPDVLHTDSLVPFYASIYIHQLPADSWALGHAWLERIIHQSRASSESDSEHRGSSDALNLLISCEGLLRAWIGDPGLARIYSCWEKTVEKLISRTADMSWVKHAPIDLRWNPDAMDKVIECATRNNLESENTFKKCELDDIFNRLILLQDILTIRHLTDSWLTNQITPHAPLHISYLHHMKQGHTQQLVREEAVIVHLYPLYQSLLSNLHELSLEIPSLSDGDLSQIRHELLWLSRFLTVCQLPLLSVHKLSGQISLFWNWLHKHLITPLSTRSSSHGLSQDLKVIVKNVMATCSTDDSANRVLSLLYKTWPHPECPQRQEDAERFLLEMQSDDCWMTPGQMEPPQVSAPEPEVTDDDQSDCPQSTLPNTPANDITARLWPLKDLIAVKIEQKLVAEVITGNHHANIESYSPFIEKVMPPVSSAHYAILKRFSLSKGEGRAELGPLLTSLMRRQWSSCATVHLSTWMTAGQTRAPSCESRSEIDQSDIQGPGSLQRCPLSKISFALLADDEIHNSKRSTFASVSLGNQQKMEQILSEFGDTLWVNAPIFSHHSDRRVEDHKLRAMINLFVNQIVEAVKSEVPKQSRLTSMERLMPDSDHRSICVIKNDLNGLLEGEISCEVLRLLNDCVDYLVDGSEDNEGREVKGVCVDTGSDGIGESAKESGSKVNVRTNWSLESVSGRMGGIYDGTVYGASASAQDETGSGSENVADIRKTDCKDDNINADCHEKTPSVVDDVGIHGPEYVNMGQVYVKMGLLMNSILLPRGPVDPVEKRAIKLRLIIQELEDVVSELSVYQEHYRNLTGCDLSSAHRSRCHPTIVALWDRQLWLEVKKQKLLVKQAYRPTPAQYDELKIALKSYKETMVDNGKVLKMADNLRAAYRTLKSGGIPRNLRQLLTEEQSWQTTQHKFVSYVQSEFPLYRDLWQWFVVGVGLCQHGLRMMASHVRSVYDTMTIAKSLTKGDQRIEELILLFARLPSIGIATPDLHSVVASICRDSAFSLIETILCEESSRELPKILIACLDWLRLHAAIDGGIRPEVLETANGIVGRFVCLWREQAELAKQKQLEKESLYKIMTFGDELNEEEQEEEDFKKTFPSYDEDFANIISVDNLNEPSSKFERKQNAKGDQQHAKGDQQQEVISLDDMSKVIRLHSQIYTYDANRLEVNQSEIDTTDWLRCFMRSYHVASALERKTSHVIDSELDPPLIAGHLVVNAIRIATVTLSSQNSGFRIPSDAPYDIYHHSNVNEVIKCRPIITDYQTKIVELSNQWPDHPNLTQITRVIDKILSFPITSPVMKFLVGLELLIERSQAWEENAARHVSVSTHLNIISRQIVEWRKMELECWKNALDTEELKAKDVASKWWFHLHDIIGSFINGESSELNQSEMISSLKRFIEASTIGEFTTRLAYLRAFYGQLRRMAASASQGALANVLCNILAYYAQITPRVEREISEKRAPIEKQLKDFVKIARWNDINYWALRQATLRTHRTIFKHVREFRKILDSPVNDLLGEDASEAASVCDDSTQPPAWITSLEDYTRDCRVGDQPAPLNEMADIEGLVQWPILSRATTLCTKLTTHSGTLVKRLQYTEMTIALNEFIGDVIHGVLELQGLKVNTEADKEKQRSEARHIVLQKRRGLSDLFRNLSKLGLSYKRGLVLERSDVLENCLTTSHLDDCHLLHARSEQEAFTLILEDCSKYFYKCLLRLSKFLPAVTQPSKEIGVSNLERFRGYTHLLMQHVIGQRDSIAEHAQKLQQIESFVKLLKDTVDRPHSLPLHLKNDTPVDSFLALLVTIEEGLSQLLLVVKSCPAQIDSAPCPIPVANRPRVCGMTRGADDFTSLVTTIEAVITRARTLKWSVKQTFLTKNNLNKLVSCNIPEHDVLQLSLREQELLALVDTLESLTALFQDPLTQDLSVFGDVISFLCEKISKFHDGFVLWMDQSQFSKERDLHIGKFVMSTDSPYSSQQTENVQIVNAGNFNNDVPNSEADDICENAQSIEASGMAVDDIISTVLLVVQNMMKLGIAGERIERISMEIEKQTDGDKTEDTDTESDMLEGCLKTLILELPLHIGYLNSGKMITKLEAIFGLLASRPCLSPLLRDHQQQLLTLALPFLERYIRLSQFILVQSLAVHRTTSKLLSVLLNLFTELCLKGFCLPEELSDELMGEGATQFADIEGGGLGEGEGSKNVSDQLESEDQIEEGKTAEDWKKEEQEEQPDVESEKNAIEMSTDFDAKVQDLGDEDKRSDDENDGDDDNEENELDKQMGEVDKEEERLDEQMWGSDDEGDTTDRDKDEKGTGDGKQSESELVAKGDNEDENESERKRNNQEDDEGGGEDNKDDNVNEQQGIDESEYDDDRIDPNHGQMDGGEEPEAMDLPEELDLDAREDGNEEEVQEGGVEQELEDDNPDGMETNEEAINEEEKDGAGEEDKGGKPDEVGDSKDEDPMTMDDAKDEPTQEDHEKDDEEPDTADKGDDSAKYSDDDGTNGIEGYDAPEEPRIKESEADDKEDATSAEHYGKTSNDSAEVEKSDTAQDIASNEADNLTEENEGQGSAMSEDIVGHESQSSNKVMRGGTSNIPKNQKRKPGHADPDRTLGSNEREYKRLRTLDSTITDTTQQLQESMNQGTEYEHIPKGDDTTTADAATLDVATDQQQSDPQAVPNVDLEDGLDSQEDEEILMREETQDDQKLEELLGAKMLGEPMKEIDGDDREGGLEEEDTEEGSQVETAGERVVTSTVGRGDDATIHTDMELLEDYLDDSQINVEEMRQEMEHQLSLWQQTRLSQQESSDAWQKYEALTSSLSQQLCEQLRLVLEPTQAAKMRGDYRTGKRLNMRKVIAYIASQFRKDKIWLRRTKPSRRQYQIMLAIDDSSSMLDNHSKQLAFESMAVIANALTLLEVGQLAICSFGESVRLLHPFTEQFNNHSGASILQQFQFDQKRTKIAELVKYATAVMVNARNHTPGGWGHPETSQLLLMVSDGRGLFNEGMETVRRAVRMARHAGVFMVFVVIDNPANKDSILDIKVPVFKQAGQPPDIRPYMDHFPFPFYIILRDINSLPTILSDALRQWFELVTSSDR